MQLFCPTCGTLISADDINIDRALATCRACKSVTSMDEAGSQVVAPEARSSPKRTNRREIPCPIHFSVKNDGNSLRICFWWIWGGFLNSLMFCFLWNSFVIFYYWMALRIQDRLMWLPVVWGILHVLIGLWLVYVTLIRLLNRTVINLTSEFLTIRHVPFPWWGNTRLPVDELDRLYCHRDASLAKRGGRYFYTLNAAVKGGTTLELVKDFPNPAEPLFIKQKLERWLRMEEHSWSGLRIHEPAGSNQ
jgi:hypothetical protein